ncbi:MAG: C25 family cysteine peptidase, partial [Planctomycetota bacterium]
LVGVPDGASWQDFAYLAAVPAARHRSKGKPSVVALPPSGEVGRELADYVARYRPGEVFALGIAAGAKAPAGIKWKVLAADSADAAACELATRSWDKCQRVVVCRDDDYASALVASALAARLDCPLLYCGERKLSREAESAIKKLGVRSVITVGELPRHAISRRLRPVALADAAAVIGWARRNDVAVDYFAAANPFDRAATLKPKLSLIAPLLAAAREGLVVPLEYESHWMNEFEAKEVAGDAARGLKPGVEPPRTGTATIRGRKVDFAIALTKGGRGGAEKGGPLHRIYLDLNADGSYSGTGEGPFWSADAAKIGARRCTLVAGVKGKGKKRKVFLQTCYPAAGDVSDRLRKHWRARGGAPSYLCIIGHPDAVPFWLALDGPAAERFVASDVPYANTDDDPFAEIAVGRIIAEHVTYGTLHASRQITYESLLDPRWSEGVGFARWEDSLGPQFANVGFLTQHYHSKHDRPMIKDKKGKSKHAGSFAAHSPLARVAAIVHGSHSWYMGLGETYTVESDVLLAPCVVETAGCGPTALHVDKKFISVVSRLFRNGAVAFHGNAVPSPAPHQELRYAFWKSVLGGRTVGAAHRDALNCKMLTVIEAGQLERGGVDRRTMIMRHLYGDPAFKLRLPGERRVKPACVEVAGDKVTVRGPEKWYVVQIRVPEDWKDWATKPLFVLRAPGVYIRANWCGKKYDIEEIYADAAVTTRRAVKRIEQVQKLAAPLGWRGKYFVDKNPDGTRTYRWRVRMADFDQTTGTIRSTVDRADYRIVY